MAVSRWMPIETAPKRHAEEFLACSMGPYGLVRSAVVFWLGRENVMYGEEDGFVSGYYISDGHNEPRWYRGWSDLTHWMPLPDPPSDTHVTIPRMRMGLVPKDEQFPA